MFDPKIWQLTRHMFDEHNTKQSLTLGVGAGVGLFAAGSGILPAIVGISVVSASAGLLRGLWDDFKRKNRQSSYEEIAMQWKTLPEADSRSTALQKASVYNNFFDTVAKSMVRKENVDMRDISWMHKLSARIEDAIDNSIQRKQSVEALQYLQEKTQAAWFPKIEEAASTTFSRAVNWRIERDLDSMTATVNRMSDAMEANAIGAVAKPGISPAEDEVLYNSRQVHLQNKLAVIRETIEGGLLLGNKSEASAQSELKHIADSVNRMGPQLPPVKISIEAEAPLVEKLQDTTYYESVYARERGFNAQLYTDWNNSFSRGASSLEPNQIAKNLQTFHSQLIKRIETKGIAIDAAPLFLAEKLYDRIAKVATQPGIDAQAKDMLLNVQQSTRDVLIEHAPKTVLINAVQFEFLPNIGGNYDRALGQGKFIEDTAKLQVLASRFAPEFEDTFAASRIPKEAVKIQENLLAPHVFDSDDRLLKWREVKVQMQATNDAVAQMRAFQETRKERIAENEKSPTISHTFLQNEWQKTFLQGMEAVLPSSIIQAYETFDNTFTVFKKQHGPSIGTMEYSALMHEHLSSTLFQAEGNKLTNMDTIVKLRTLLDKTESYLEGNAANVAKTEISKLTDTPLHTYSEISYEAGRTRSAAMAQAYAAQFVPAANVDNVQVERIQQQFEKVQASMAMGPLVDDKPIAMLVKDNVHESVRLSIVQAAYQIEQMQKANSIQQVVNMTDMQTP